MSIEINTTQNVLLNYKPAGLGLRLLSILLDSVFRYVYLLILVMIVFKGWIEDLNDSYHPASRREIMIAVIIIFLLPFFLYHLLCETFLNGQSLGKKIVKIRVVKLDGSQPSFWAYLIRSVFRIIDDSIVGLLCIAFTKHTQRVGDMVAGTTVVELSQKVTLADTILKEQQKDYRIVYEQVSLMTDKDANIIREVLQFADENEDSPHVKTLADKIRSKYGIAKTEVPDDEFLHTLLTDYNHYRFEN